MSKWFHRGKFARMRGEERAVKDGRISPQSRQEFYEGWDEQDRYMQPPLTSDQEAERDEALAGIQAFLAANTEVSDRPGSGQ